MGITVAVLGRREPQELKVKAPRPCLGKLVGLGDAAVVGGWCSDGAAVAGWCSDAAVTST